MDTVHGHTCKNKAHMLKDKHQSAAHTVFNKEVTGRSFELAVCLTVSATEDHNLAALAQHTTGMLNAQEPAKVNRASQLV